jgi:hypothetical protein
MTKIAQKPILLLVDEVMKFGEELATALLHNIAECLGKSNNFETVISTLNPGPILAEKTNSGRKVVWLNLSPLSLEESLRLFKNFPLNDEAKLAISDCNGHPRSLECIWHAFTKTPTNESINHEFTMKIAIQNWGSRYSQITPTHLKVALEGKTLRVTDKVEGLLPITEIQTGIFLNVNATTHFVPCLSPFALRVFIQESDPTDPVITLLMKLLQTEEGFDWKEFEKFHGLWECLKRCIFEGRTVSLNDFYLVPDQDEFDDWPQFVLQKKKKKFLQTNFADAKFELHYLESKLIIPGAGNPGFDMVSFEVDIKTKAMCAVCIECRYSRPGACTMLKKSDVLSKYDLAVDQITRNQSVHLTFRFTCNWKNPT